MLMHEGFFFGQLAYSTRQAAPHHVLSLSHEFQICWPWNVASIDCCPC